VFYEVVRGVPVAALTRSELERAHTVALDAYAAGRASRNVPVRKQDRNPFIHELITAGERDWDKILQAVLAKDARWATKKDRLVTVKALRNGYAVWLKGRTGP
jgi:hypothetical protein